MHCSPMRSAVPCPAGTNFILIGRPHASSARREWASVRTVICMKWQAALAPECQRKEIELSCAFVESVGGSRLWGYCYPHGVAASFSPETEKAVADAGCPFAFAVEASDITAPLAETRRFALPRHNCNAFPHGAVSYGEQVPA